MTRNLKKTKTKMQHIGSVQSREMDPAGGYPTVRKSARNRAKSKSTKSKETNPGLGEHKWADF